MPFSTVPVIQNHYQSSAGLDDCVGALLVWNPEGGEAHNPFNIFRDEEIYIGRDYSICQYVVDDPFVSNKHVRIYTIIYDYENPQEVAPLVYAQDVSRNGTYWNGFLIGKNSNGVLLSDADVLQLSPNFYLQFRCNPIETRIPFDAVQKEEMKWFNKEYTITQRKLGSGAHGQVYMAINNCTGQQLACKVVDIRVSRERLKDSKPDNGDNQTTSIKKKQRFYDREAEILAQIRHPNIITLEKVIKTENTIYILQDLLTAGDLFSFVEYKGGKLYDTEAAVILRQVLMALDYLHGQDIVHRDLKPDNILMTSLADGCRVVLTDFGCARMLKPSLNRMSTMVGTLEYSAPEITLKAPKERRGYTKAVDMWSVGCLTVVLLTGGLPFRDPATLKFSEKHARVCDLEQLKFDQDWIYVCERPKDFVYRLLVLDENERMDVRQALQHHWFTNPSHKLDFDKVYLRAVKNWEPRPYRGKAIIDLDSYKQEPWCREQDRKEGPVRSSSRSDLNLRNLVSHARLSGAAEGSSSTSSDMPMSSAGKQRVPKSVIAPSSTLSDPRFPRGNFDTEDFALIESEAREAAVPSQALETTINLVDTGLRLPFSSNAWNEPSKEDIFKAFVVDENNTECKEPSLSARSQVADVRGAEIKVENFKQETAYQRHHLRHPRKVMVAPVKKRPVGDIYDLEMDVCL